jgi:hypothetical protein
MDFLDEESRKSRMGYGGRSVGNNLLKYLGD